MLKKTHLNRPDVKVLDSMELLCPHQMMACSRATNALEMYTVSSLQREGMCLL